MAQAQRYIAEGYNVVVDLDLDKFFDRVDHDGLMARVAARVTDKRVLRLIRAFLKAGVMEGGLVSPVDEGTPQGGPPVPRYWLWYTYRMLAGGWADSITMSVEGPAGVLEIKSTSWCGSAPGRVRL